MDDGHTAYSPDWLYGPQLAYRLRRRGMLVRLMSIRVSIRIGMRVIVCRCFLGELDHAIWLLVDHTVGCADVVSARRGTRGRVGVCTWYERLAEVRHVPAQALVWLLRRWVGVWRRLGIVLWISCCQLVRIFKWSGSRHTTLDVDNLLWSHRGCLLGLTVARLIRVPAPPPSPARHGEPPLAAHLTHRLRRRRRS